MEKENPKKETPEVELFPPDNPMFIMANALIALTEQLKKDTSNTKTNNQNREDKSMKENYFEEIKMRFIKAAMWTNDNAKDNDVNRNHTNYGCCTCWAQVLQDMGHETEVPVYEDNGVLKIPFISIDKEKILEFEK